MNRVIALVFLFIADASWADEELPLWWAKTDFSSCSIGLNQFRQKGDDSVVNLYFERPHVGINGYHDNLLRGEEARVIFYISITPIDSFYEDAREVTRVSVNTTSNSYVPHLHPHWKESSYYMAGKSAEAIWNAFVSGGDVEIAFTISEEEKSLLVKGLFFERVSKMYNACSE